MQKQKDIKEVERDLALIKSPAAGLKKANKVKSFREGFDVIDVNDSFAFKVEDEEMMEDVEVDTSLNIGQKEAVGRKEEARIEETHESDHEMEKDE